jgi:RNA binding exosome subunit
VKGPIQSVEVTYLLHATEDEEKVANAVGALLYVNGAEEVEELEGHFGNPIKRVRVHLTGEQASQGLERLLGKMPEGLRKEVVGALGKHLDEHNALFLRFDKQSLVSGSLSLGEKDPVRVKVKPRGFMMKGGAAQFFADMLAGS